MAYTHANTVFHRGYATRYAANGLGRLASRAFDVILRWEDRARGRRELAQLDDRLLRDIGLNRIDAIREADKPFWKR
jgi:uncharacterized protein YjiS (DUF1127 family)